MLGVFDSGSGGLTALGLLHRLLPEADLCYLGDPARLPYGKRPDGVIRQYAREAVAFFERRGARALLCACGTVSTVALPGLLAPFPLFGVAVPAAMEAARISRTGKIGIIGTDAAIRSGVYSTALRHFRPDAQAVCVPCPLFVPLAEYGYRAQDPVVRRATQRALAPIRRSGCDVLILGCTHFVALRSAIAAAVPGVALVDCGEAGARLFADAFPERGSGRVEVYVTESPAAFDRIAYLRGIPDYPGAQKTLL